MKKLFTLLILLFFVSTTSIAQCNVSVSVTDNGDGTSTLLATPTGASANGSDTFSYSWDTGGSGDQITVNNDGMTYCVTLTNDYTSDEQVLVTAGYWQSDGYYDYYGYWVDTSYYVDPVYETQTTNQTCSASDCGSVATSSVDCSATNVSISETTPGQLDAIATGNGTINYAWTPNGETTQSINTVPGTEYAVTITDDNGCTATDTYSTGVDCSGTNVSISESTPGQLDAIATGNGTINYAWTPNGETTQSINTTNGVTEYAVTITDDNGCTATDSYTTGVDCSAFNVSISESTPGQLDAIASGFTSPTYQWDPTGETTQSINTTNGVTEYTVTVTGDGCSATDTYSTGVDCSAFNVSISESTPGQLDAIASGFTSPTYQWDPTGETTQSINSTSGTSEYTVTVTGDGCTATDVYTVNACSAFNVSISESTPGQLDAIASGFTSPTYQWDPTGETSQSINITSGTTEYTVTVTGDGCTATDTYTANLCDGFAVSISETTPGQLDAIASGFTSPSYTWEPTGENTQSVNTSSTVTEYTVIVSGDGCTVTDTYSVNGVPEANFEVDDTEPCKSQTITLTDLSLHDPTSWQWSMPGGNPSSSTAQNPTVSYNTVGTHTISLIATNAIGSSTVVEMEITVAGNPTVSVISQTICSGDATVLIALGADSYSWSNGWPFSIMPVTSTTATTTYTVIGTTACGSHTTTGKVVVKPNPSITVSSKTICPGSSATLTATGGSSYSWDSGSTSSVTVVSPNVTTMYQVTGYGTNGCSSAKTATVVVKSTINLIANAPNICAGKTATLVASGATTYHWNTGANTNSITVTPTSTTIYTVTGSAVGSCSTAITTTVTVNPTPTISVISATICSGATGTVIASGANTYVWNTGISGSVLTASPTITKTYTVTGTDINGCVKTTTGSIVVSTAPVISVSSKTICAGYSAFLNANGATSYTWNTGANTNTLSVTPASTTVYTVSGNLVGCSTGSTKTATVFVNPSPSISVTSATVCASSTTTITASGSSTYNWSTGSSLASIAVSPTATTVYTVTSVGSNGCTAKAQSTVTVKPAPILVANSVTICAGKTTTLSVSGGTTYIWSNGSSASSIIVTPATTTSYTVSSTGFGCTSKKVVTVTVKASPALSVVSPTICPAATATVIANGATTYSWSNGISVNSFTAHPSSNTVYTVIGTTNGCSKTMTASITLATNPGISVSSLTMCAGTPTILTANGVTTYTWNTGVNTNTLSVNPTSTTVYTVSGKLTGCVGLAVATATVKVNTPPIVTLAALTSNTMCINGQTIALSGTPSGGVYAGSGVSGNQFNPSAAGAGTYTLTYNYTSSNGCSGHASQSVLVDLCNGIEDIEMGAMSIYPNPTESEFTITISANDINQLKLEIYNDLGQITHTRMLYSESTTISLANVPSGIYLLKLSNTKKQVVKKIIKQ